MRERAGAGPRWFENRSPPCSQALNAHGDPNCINFGGFNAPRTEGFQKEAGLERSPAEALMLAVGGGYMEVRRHPQPRHTAFRPAWYRM